MSDLPVYPIPAPGPDPDRLPQLLAAQQTALSAVLSDLYDTLQGGLAYQQANLKKVGARLQRVLTKQVQAQREALAPVANALAQDLAGRVEAQRALLAGGEPIVAFGPEGQPILQPEDQPAAEPTQVDPYSGLPVVGGAYDPGAPVTVGFGAGGQPVSYRPLTYHTTVGTGPLRPAGSQAPPGVPTTGGASPAGFPPTPPGGYAPDTGAAPGPPTAVYAPAPAPGLPPVGAPQPPTPPAPGPLLPPGAPQPPGAPAPGAPAPAPPGAPAQPPGGVSPGVPLPPTSPNQPVFPTPPGPPAPGQPPTPPTPPTPVLPGPLACTLVLPQGWEGGLPAPGSDAWCAGFTAIRDAFADLGNAVIRWATGGGPEGVLGLLGLGKGASQAAAPGAGGILGAVGVPTGPPADPEAIRAFVKCWYDALTTTGACNVPVLLALCVLQALLRILSDVKVGWTFIVELTVRLHLALEPIMRLVQLLIDAECPSEIPGISEAIECWLHGEITDDVFRCWMLMRGADPQVWTAVARARRDRLSAEELIELARRRGVPDDQVPDMLRGVGMLDAEEQQARLELYDELPSIQDHLHWLQRNVFIDEYVQDYGLLDGFSDRFWSKFGPDLRAQGMKEEYARLHYAAHWIQPAPGQLGEMLQRLRPGRVDASVQFTEQDYLRLLAEQDVAPYFRARMRAVAYNVFGLRFLRQLYDTYQVDDGELAERFQDLGYSPADAALLVGSERQRRARTRATQARGWTVPRAVMAVRLGHVDFETAHVAIAEQGWTRDELRTAVEAGNAEEAQRLDRAAQQSTRTAATAAILGCYQDGICGRDETAAALRQAGWSDQLIGVRLGALDVQARRKLVTEGVAAIRSAYRQGRLSAADAQTQLVRLGLQPDRAEQRLAVWEARQTVRRKEVTAGQLIKAVESGLLSADQVRGRLVNLGYSDPDAMLLLGQARVEIAAREGKALAAAARGQAARMHQLEKLQQQAQKQADALQARLRRLTPVAKLQKWLKLGIIGEDYFLRRLKAQGYPDDVARDYLAEANAPPRPRAPRKAAPPAPPP